MGFIEGENSYGSCVFIVFYLLFFILRIRNKFVVVILIFLIWNNLKMIVVRGINLILVLFLVYVLRFVEFFKSYIFGGWVRESYFF